METRFKNKFMMYHAVALLCDKPAYREIWTKVQSFVAAHAEFTQKFSALQKLANGPQIGEAMKDKAEAQRQLVNRAHYLAGLVHAVAVEKKSPGLEERVAFSKTDLAKTRAIIFVARCRTVLDAARENLADLATSNVTTESLDAFAENLRQYESIAVGPQSVRMVRKSNGAQIVSIVAEVDTILRKRMDRIAVGWEESHPDFYLNYRNARTIIDTPGPRRSENPASPELGSDHPETGDDPAPAAVNSPASA